MGISRVALAICIAASAAAAGSIAGLSLQAADGKTLTLEEMRAGRDATVLVFWSGGCPCVRRYQERVDALLDAYPPERVRVAAISSNAGESLADALRVAAERGVRVPIFRDEGGRLAAALGARSTPTVVLLDKAGAVRFLGWIDNERQQGDPKREPWLELAIQGILDQRAFAARTPVYGCTITRSLFGASPGRCCHEQH